MKKCIINFRKNFFGGKIVTDKSESLTKLEEDEKYNSVNSIEVIRHDFINGYLSE